MKRVSLAAAAVACAFPALASGGTAAQPSLQLLKLIPPSVHGTHFKAGEKVGLTLIAGKAKIVRSVRVSRAGQFTVVFGGITELQRCGLAAPFILVGTPGSRLTLKVPQSGCTSSGVTPAVTTPTAPPTSGGGTGGLEPPPPYTT